ncbi:hypothetical protein D9M71_515580 [compost metagenome]
MGLTVEGSQCHLAAAKLQLAERGVDNLPVELESLVGGHLCYQVEQGGNGAARGKDGNVVRGLGGIEDALQASLNAFDKVLPGFQLGHVMFAADPAGHKQREQALEFGAVLIAIAQDIQRFRFLRQ